VEGMDEINLGRSILSGLKRSQRAQRKSIPMFGDRRRLKQARALADMKTTIPNAFGADFTANGGMNCAPQTQV
jgi:hypothetical protein